MATASHAPLRRRPLGSISEIDSRVQTKLRRTEVGQREVCAF